MTEEEKILGYGATLVLTEPVQLAIECNNRSRKQAYTRFITHNMYMISGYERDSYLMLPRKVKKMIKNAVRTGCYYDSKKKRVTILPPYLYDQIRNSLYRSFPLEESAKMIEEAEGQAGENER